MRHKSMIFLCMMIFGLVLGTSSAALAQYSLSLEATSDGTTPKTQFDRGENLYLKIVLNNAAGVAGCAFTLNYPTAVLSPPATNSEGLPVNLNDITSAFPFTSGTTRTHRENSSEAGKIYLAGAEIHTTLGGAKYQPGPITLFTVKFTVKNDATFGAFNISLARTELFNPGAGYGTDVDGDGVFDPGDTKGTVPVLVGAVDKTHPNYNNLSAAFPVLLDTASLAQTSPYVLDGDTIDDAWEIAQFGNLTAATDLTDFDGDGYLDKYEQPSQNNTNPKVKDPADFSDPTYNAATDTRAPYQVVFGDPASPGAGAGETFDMDVYYFTSNGAQNLSGLTVRIHYDSTKLTWNSFSDLLATGLGTPSSSPQNDVSNFDSDTSTDKYLVVPWSGGNWPGAICTQQDPLKLYTVTFTVANGLAEGTLSSIRFSATSIAAGYTFSSVPAEFEVRLYDRGDLNMDGEITAQDAVDCFWLSLSPPWNPQELSLGDFNQDGDITAQDAVDIFWESLR
jgi:hypothetical protein